MSDRHDQSRSAPAAAADAGAATEAAAEAAAAASARKDRALDSIGEGSSSSVGMKLNGTPPAPGNDTDGYPPQNSEAANSKGLPNKSPQPPPPRPSSTFDAERYRADFDTSSTKLPIFPYKDELVEAVAAFQHLIVVGDTGSGKTTQLPQYLHEAMPEARILVTQPRRIAAISAATRVAEETRTRLGSLVGYSVRFESVRSASTKILYMTDGALLRSVATRRLQDSSLVGGGGGGNGGGAALEDLADIIILDEAHERSLETDVLFGLLRTLAQSRPSLKLIIMSATLNADKFSDFFDQAPVFSVPGRVFPVDIFYARRVKMSALKGQYVNRAVEAVVAIHSNEDPGDVLVFLTGQQDIETACRLVREAVDALQPSDLKAYPAVRAISVHPIYSALDTAEQKAVFRPAKDGYRKIVVATNIAQTSVTIPGIRYVVDSGFVKEKMFHPKTGVDALIVVPISKAAATQRAGRAGRTAPGKVFRLYSQDAFETLEMDTTPEIQRSSLLGTVLSLKKIGIANVLDFEFIDPPERSLIVTALRQLYYLGALDPDGALTPLGHQMSLLPTSPFLARALIAACTPPADHQDNCGEEMLTLVAMLSSEDPFLAPRAEDKRAEAELIHARFGGGGGGGDASVSAAAAAGKKSSAAAKTRQPPRSFVSGDHLALVRVFDAFVQACGGGGAGGGGAAQEAQWCRRRFLRLRALRAARSVREQVAEILTGELGLRLGSCRIRAAAPLPSPSPRKRRRRDDDDEEMDVDDNGNDDRQRRRGGSFRSDQRSGASPRRRRNNGHGHRDRRRGGGFGGVDRDDDYDYDGSGHYDADDGDDPARDVLASFDHVPILKAVCAGFFVNTARRHPHRNMYYHYLISSGAVGRSDLSVGGGGGSGSGGKTKDDGDKDNDDDGDDDDADAANAMMSLYIHPSSCLAFAYRAAAAPSSSSSMSMAPSSSIHHHHHHHHQLPDWVVYQDLQFVTRANMRVVSRIDFAWDESAVLGKRQRRSVAGEVEGSSATATVPVPVVGEGGRGDDGAQRGQDGPSVPPPPLAAGAAAAGRAAGAGGSAGAAAVAADTAAGAAAAAVAAAAASAAAAGAAAARDEKAEAAKARYLARKGRR
ncbi:P-loop containing nucleoside triphosphate hydrolase protein [Zopfochytrium polystomum]|nr:P-loop containing nucleoside triphosphate hydrolase protein [Zopfochytrium polystomum]